MPKSGGRRSATLHEWGTPLTRNARHVLILKVQSDIINTSISWFTSDDIVDKITDDEPQSAELQILPHRSTTPVSSESTSAATANRDLTTSARRREAPYHRRASSKKQLSRFQRRHGFPALIWFPPLRVHWPYPRPTAAFQLQDPILVSTRTKNHQTFDVASSNIRAARALSTALSLRDHRSYTAYRPP
ncbi:uncharacterized protein CC84DRAFT_1209435 [Paraphaeosphaeria sporulosa]|uniref:Uncharacterized protein n=1 Tax=Paraphaeosphaeria sporulosa TaxID=1460663 RepID=A0A177C1I8_9PLEO|nr:uncharacterized protein CC84DRAFT_1209435 [Paraphaeosphaeria sporulosa]OAG00480.1 hypothetical protein CC84DRAFT_1209435 [Paraphaeosphaeria sporulosa]